MNEQQSQSDFLKSVLLSYKIQTYDFEELRGTNVTLYKFRPMLGMRISRITGIKNELSAALRVPSVRIIAPMADGSVGPCRNATSVSGWCNRSRKVGWFECDAYVIDAQTQS